MPQPPLPQPQAPAPGLVERLAPQDSMATLALMRTRTDTTWRSPSPTRLGRRLVAGNLAEIAAAGACLSIFRGPRARARVVHG